MIAVLLKTRQHPKTLSELKLEFLLYWHAFDELTKTKSAQA